MENKEVLLFLIKVRDKGIVVLVAGTSREEKRLIEYCEEKGLIKEKNVRKTYKITENGRKAIEHGGDVFFLDKGNASTNNTNSIVINQGANSTINRSFNTQEIDPVSKDTLSKKTFKHIKDNIYQYIIGSLVNPILAYFR